MQIKQVDVAIIGGGPAGLSAAVSAKEQGAKDVLVIERDTVLGGILNQCIHAGFGLHTFGRELTGPEYALQYIEMLKKTDVEVWLDTMVLSIGQDRRITMVSSEHGFCTVQAKAIVLAMGCRERPRGALAIPGTRPAGVYAAGTAQRMVNLEGLLPGKDVVILGSGDIGLIMARRMVFEGAKVHAVCELMSYSGGLQRNIVQCLEDLDIPLLLSHTAVKIHGDRRVEAVTIAKVDDATKKPIPGTEQTIPCDTLLLSVGLLPENELSQALGVTLSPITGGPEVDDSFMTCIEGVFACGNVLHVHDLVDFVSQEAKQAGANAAQFAMTGEERKANIQMQTGRNVRYTVPQRVTAGEKVNIRFRVGAPEKKVKLVATQNGTVLKAQRKPVVAPGEMETMALDLSGVLAENGPITVAVEEA
jgi:thioredoxin reductase